MNAKPGHPDVQHRQLNTTQRKTFVLISLIQRARELGRTRYLRSVI